MMFLSFYKKRLASMRMYLYDFQALILFFACNVE
jgi:hypothetical protein